MNQRKVVKQIGLRTGKWAMVLVLLSVLFVQQSVFAAAGEIDGTVFRDYNANGVQDTYEPGIEGAIVTIYDANGVSATTPTGAGGAYTIAKGGLTGQNVRVEFTLPSSLDFLEPGAAGGTTVQFANIDTGATLNVGFNNPAQYSEPVPEVVTSYFVNGDPLGGGTTGTSNAFVSFPYDSFGDTTAPNTVAIGSQIGAVWGTAPHSVSQSVFSAAIMKRHTGFGPLGTGGIYKLNLPSTASNFIDVKTIGIDTGADIHTGLGAAATTPTHDPAAFDAVGKYSIGDMDMSEDEQTLWLVNLYDRTLYSIDIGYSAATPTSTDVAKFPIPDPGCSNGEYRPWGIDTYDGKIYVGIVCSAETSQSITDLEAYVLSMDADAAAPGLFTQVFTMGLDSVVYPRGYISTNAGNTPSAEWLPWIDSWSDIRDPLSPMPAPGEPGDGPWGQTMYPQPILTDIEFDIDGSMILAFTDRFAHQAGNENYSTDTGSNTTYEAATAGDIIRVCNDSGSFVLENNATCPGGTPTNTGTSNQGPGGREYYWQDMYELGTVDSGTHQEITVGSMAHKFGSNELLTAVFDPVDAYRAGGVSWFSQSDGNRPRSFEIFGKDEGGQPATFGKAAGIGDVEILADPTPIELGNRVWEDNNNNGLQDPGELGLGTVQVGLYDTSNNLIATTNTDPNGNYYFSNASCSSISTDVQIASSTDDAEERLYTNGGVYPGSMLLTSTDLELGLDDNLLNRPQLVGLRFPGLAIPNGATITSAYIQFTAQSSDNMGNPASFTIYGQAADNPPAFSNTDDDISSRTPTGQTVTWSGILDWVNDDSGSDQRTANLSPIVQEIVNRGGWADGNAMVFIVDQAINYFRDADSFDGNAAGAPHLFVEYQAADCADIQYNTDYEIRIDMSTQVGGRGLTVPNAPQPANNNITATTNNAIQDVSDSDAMLSGTTAVIALTTGGPGTNNHGLDFGFNNANPYDFGDLPDTFDTTSAQAGPYHTINANLYLGTCVDGETNGQPDAVAGVFGVGGDDNSVTGSVTGTCTGNDDEDGVVLTTLLQAGNAACVDVTAVNTLGSNAYLYGWVDFNGNGSFDTSEMLNTDAFSAGSVTIGSSGTANYCFDVPGGATVSGGGTHMRFRYTTDPLTSSEWGGSAPDGEVEDYYAAVDLGDLPDTFDTTISSNGAAHFLVNDLYLGDCVDGEADGQPDNPNAGVTGSNNGLGDDGNPIAPATTSTRGTCAVAGDDEDGIVLTTPLVAGGTTCMNVTAVNGTGSDAFLYGWLDFNGDGSFDASELLNTNSFTGGQVTIAATGTTNYCFDTPGATFVGGKAHMRFRFTSDLFLGSDWGGLASNGEVEDYYITTDWGDLPDTFGTTLAANGPSHNLTNDLYLGSCVDAEVNGQPDPTAGAAGGNTGFGDNGNPVAPETAAHFGVCTDVGDDEDGITLVTPLVPGLQACVKMDAYNPNGLNAILYGWMDFNGDGVFTPAEALTNGTGGTGGNFSGGSVAVGATVNNQTYCFEVPSGANFDDGGDTHMRFRLTTDTLTTSDWVGAATNGEVEDYYTQLACVGNYVWDDSTGTVPSVQDGGDTAISGVPMRLVSAGPNGVIDSAPGAATPQGDDVFYDDTTDANGVYGFCGLTPQATKAYRIDMPNPPGAQPVAVTPGVGGNSNRDSNGNQSFLGGPVSTEPFTINYPVSLPTGENGNQDNPNSSDNYPDIQNDLSLDFGLLVDVLDRGDLLDSYSTTNASNGPSHIVSGLLRMGNCVDAEVNGQPNVQAGVTGVGGDDGNVGTPVQGSCATAGDDEDGLTIPGLVAGSPINLNTQVEYPGTGGPLAILAGWYDSNANGSFADAGDVLTPITNIAQGTSGNQTLTIPTITAATLNETLGCRTSLRLRLSTDTTNGANLWYDGGVPNPTGYAPNGEVEDYVLVCATGFEADYGDHFEGADYDTTLLSDGPRHYYATTPPANYLGQCLDTELNGQHHISATGDDDNEAGAAQNTYGSCSPSNNDEDGVTMDVNDLKWGDGTGSINIDVTGAGCVVGWADWNNDGQFAGTVNDGIGNVSEFLFAVDVTAPGVTGQPIITPHGTNDGGSYVYPGGLNTRYRLFEGACASLSGPQSMSVGTAVGGEVEDYQWSFAPTAVTLQSFNANGNIAGPLGFIVVIGLLLVAGSFIMLRRRKVME